MGIYDECKDLFRQWHNRKEIKRLYKLIAKKNNDRIESDKQYNQKLIDRMYELEPELTKLFLKQLEHDRMIDESIAKVRQDLEELKQEFAEIQLSYKY